LTIYTQTNHLAAVNSPLSAVGYEYNSLDDRLQQVSGGVTTRYALDLNNDLAQVLSDGSRKSKHQ